MTGHNHRGILTANLHRTDDGRLWLTTNAGRYTRLNNRWHHQTTTGTLTVSHHYTRFLLNRRLETVTK